MKVRALIAAAEAVDRPARSQAGKPDLRNSRQRGFTLVELLVAMALTLFIMVILSEAFSVGLGTFRELKAVADMQEKLRTAAMILRNDLQSNAYAGAHLSLHDCDMTDLTPTTGYIPPDSGFFRLWQQCSLSKSVTSLTSTGTTATATVASTSGYAVGDTIVIAGATPLEYNGNFFITAVTGTTVNYAFPGSSTTSASGTITAFQCYQREGNDGDSIPSYRMNQPTDAILHFSVHRTGNRPENFLSVPSLPLLTSSVSSLTSAATPSGPMATATVPNANCYSPGGVVVISGASPAGYNTTYSSPVTIQQITSPTTFTYPVSSVLAPATPGTITATAPANEGPIDFQTGIITAQPQPGHPVFPGTGDLFYSQDGEVAYFLGPSPPSPAQHGNYEERHSLRGASLCSLPAPTRRMLYAAG